MILSESQKRALFLLRSSEGEWRTIEELRIIRFSTLMGLKTKGLVEYDRPNWRISPFGYTTINSIDIGEENDLVRKNNGKSPRKGQNKNVKK